MALLNTFRRSLPEDVRDLSLEELFALGLLPVIAGGSEDDDDSDDDSSDDSDDDSADASDDGDDADADADKDKDAKPELNWKQLARRHEREAKKARQRLEQLEKDAQARENENKTEQQKAIDQAREDAKAELQTAHEKERRQDRLEAASARIAGKGVTVGEGEKAKALKFADPEDALVYLERDIRAGRLDEDDLFDSGGRVKAAALEEALTDLLERKPHLAAADSKKKVKGSADVRKGEATDTEDSVDAHFKKVRRARPEGAQQVVVSRRA